MLQIYLVKAGDPIRVSVKNSDDTRGYRGIKPFNTRATIVGKTRSRYWSSRWGIDMYSRKMPGVYEEDSCIIAQFKNTGETEVINMYDFDFVRKNTFMERHSELVAPRLKNGERSTDIEHDLRNMVRIGDLPETKFYELDRVKVAPFACDGTINHVQYSWALNEDGSYQDDRGMCYSVCLDSGGLSYLHDGDLELISRGNIYNLANDKPVKFADLSAEANFAKGRYQFEEVRNPANGLFVWNEKEALDALSAGIADGFYSSNLFPTINGSRLNPVKFHDADLGKRVRNITLLGFGRSIP